MLKTQEHKESANKLLFTVFAFIIFINIFAVLAQGAVTFLGVIIIINNIIVAGVVWLLYNMMADLMIHGAKERIALEDRQKESDKEIEKLKKWTERLEARMRSNRK